MDFVEKTAPSQATSLETIHVSTFTGFSQEAAIRESIRRTCILSWSTVSMVTESFLVNIWEWVCLLNLWSFWNISTVLPTFILRLLTEDTYIGTILLLPEVFESMTKTNNAQKRNAHNWYCAGSIGIRSLLPVRAMERSGWSGSVGKEQQRP